MRLRTGIEGLRLRHTFTIARGSQEVVRTVISEIEHEGLVGLGEASPSSYYGETADSVRFALSTLDEEIARTRLESYRELLERATEKLEENRAALCALDIALHDLVSRRTGRPLHRMLNLDPARVPLSSFTIGIDTPDRMVEKVREARDYPILKVKVGTPEDIEIIRLLRKETDALFRVDANCGWTAAETIEKSGELESLGVEFIEQPLPPAEDDAMEEVYRKSRLPVIADESCVVPSDVTGLAGRFHGINIKLVKCGGILPALDMVPAARALGMKVMFGCMIESSVGITAAASIGALADYLDLDGNVLISNDPFRGVRNDRGRLILPEGWVERV